MDARWRLPDHQCDHRQPLMSSTAPRKTGTGNRARGKGTNSQIELHMIVVQAAQPGRTPVRSEAMESPMKAEERHRVDHPL